MGAHEQVLHSFEHGSGGPEFPDHPLVLGADNNLYSTSIVGGLGGAGDGTVFSAALDGTITTVYSFAVVDPSVDGKLPDAGLLLASDGNFYGTTGDGGGGSFDPNGGTLFRISPQGALITLHAFGESTIDGKSPRGELVQGSDGMLYGTTTLGGDYGLGTIFKVSPSTGAYQQIHSFGPAFPLGPGYAAVGGLVEGNDGMFYGTTGSGGANGPNGSQNGGTIYRMTPDGVVTVIHNFLECAGDGDNPYSSLIRGVDGTFYGTTRAGGAYNHGTIFRVTPAGKVTILYSFGTLPVDGFDPFRAGLIQAGDGTLYGTTYCGGANVDPADPNCDQSTRPRGGVAFMLAPDGTYTKLHDFGAAGDASAPSSSLTQLASDTLYGVTFVGGAGDEGTLFKLTLDAALNAPSVKAIPQSCSVGAKPRARHGGGLDLLSLLVLGATGLLRRSQHLVGGSRWSLSPTRGLGDVA